jgi:hypothetical protein
VHVVVAQGGHQAGERDEQDEGGADEVGDDHDPFAIVAVREDAGQRRDGHRRNRVGEQRDGDRRAAMGKPVGEDDQREHQELVGQLSRHLRVPDQLEIALCQEMAKAGLLLRRRGVGPRRLAVVGLVSGGHPRQPLRSLGAL